MSHRKNPKKAKLLPGLDFTERQLFWIAYGRMRCVKHYPSTLREWIKDPDTVHPPAPIRVNGVLQNLQDFANDFQCPSESAMNPAKKCPRIW